MAKLSLDYLINPILDVAGLNGIKKKIAASLSGKETEVKLGVDDKNVTKAFSKIPKEAKTVGDQAGSSFGSSFTSGAKKFLAGAAIFSIFAAGAVAVKGAASEFKDFNAQLQNVESLGVKNVAALGVKLNELSKTTVDTTSNLTQGLYQAISAGITGTQDELVGFVDQASKVAVAGNATTEDAVNSLTSVLNAYKLEVGQAGKVSDIFFGAIKGGKTDFGQLNASLSNVIPAAAGAGIAFEEIAGNLAQMTALGTPTAQATTQLRAAIVELQKPGKELASVMSGVTVEIGGVKQQLTENNIAAVLKQQGLTATLQQIEQSATASGKSMTQVFSSTEAAGAALLLTGDNAETANKQLKNITKGIEEGVSTSAFESQFKSLDNQMKLVKNNVQAGFNTIFTALLPVVNNLLQTIIPVIQKIFDAIVPVIEKLVTVIGPILNNVMTLIQPLIDLLATQLVPIITNIITKIITLIKPLAALIAPVFQALTVVFAKVSPILDKFVTVLVDGLSTAINGLVPLVNMLAHTLGGILGDVLDLVLNLFIELVTNNLELINVVVELLVALTPVIQVILQLAAALINMGVKALKPLIPIFAYVVQLAGNLTKHVIGLVISIGEFLGLIKKKAPNRIGESIDEIVAREGDVKKTKTEVAGLNEELSNPEPAKNADKITTATVKTGKAHKDNTKYVVDYFKAFKDGQDDAIRMAELEDEITRIREERSKNVNDEIVDQQRLLDSLLDRKLKLEQSLKDGFVIKEDGSKIKIKADEKVDIEDMLAELNNDLRFESKNLTKLEVQAIIDERKTKREAAATILELQRERLELEVDMKIRPKTDLLAAYEKDLADLNQTITGADTVEQQKLLNERLKIQQKINGIILELNEDQANKAALAYQRSFEGIALNFAKQLSKSLDDLEPDARRIEAIENEVKAIDERKAKLLKEYKDGKISAQQYHKEIIDLEKDKSNKVTEVNREQYSILDGLQKGLVATFQSTTTLFLDSIQKQGEAMESHAQLIESTYGLAVAVIASKLGQALAEGDLTLGKLIVSAIDAAQAVMNAWAAALLVKANVEFPFGLGTIQFAGVIAAANILLTLAKAGLGGASNGVFELSNSNKGRPGNGDVIPMMLRRRETVVTPEISDRNPVIRAMVKDGMTEEQYFNKMYLPKILSKFKIDMPGMNAAMIPLEFNEVSMKKAEDTARKIAEVDSFYQKLDKEHLAIAIKRDREAKAEATKQTQLLQNMLIAQKEESQMLREDMKALKREFSHRTKVDVKLDAKVKGEDLELAMQSRNRRKSY